MSSILLRGEPGVEARLLLIDSKRGMFDVSMMCRLLGISRSSYYAWATRADRDRTDPWAAERAEVEEIWLASNGVMGARSV